MLQKMYYELKGTKIMRRTVFNQLVKWKNKPSHKPLILQGARQVGKTWLMKEIWKTGIRQNCVYQL